MTPDLYIHLQQKPFNEFRHQEITIRKKGGRLSADVILEGTTDFHLVYIRDGTKGLLGGLAEN